jgi:hypothetical protein
MTIRLKVLRGELNAVGRRAIKTLFVYLYSKASAPDGAALRTCGDPIGNLFCDSVGWGDKRAAGRFQRLFILPASRNSALERDAATTIAICMIRSEHAVCRSRFAGCAFLCHQ